MRRANKIGWSNPSINRSERTHGPAMATSQDAKPTTAGASVESELGDALLVAAQQGKLSDIRRLIEQKADVTYQEPAQGVSGLMAAAVGGHIDCVRELLLQGAPWNAVDKQGRSAGNYALVTKRQEIVDELVSAGVRAELLFAQLDKNARGGRGIAGSDKAKTDSEKYIGRGVRYEGEALLDEERDAVMMEWETPLMDAHATALCPTPGLDVLNVGFGMGIVDGLLQKRRPRTHAICEAHPGVVAEMKRRGWAQKPGVQILAKRWQDAIPELARAGRRFDAVFFDTYGEYYDDMRDFHSWLPKILKPNGIYSFFNGFCPDNIFFQGVIAQVVSIELARLGIAAEFHRCDVNVDEDKWRGVKRKYFFAKSYFLPVCRLQPPARIAQDAKAGHTSDEATPSAPKSDSPALKKRKTKSAALVDGTATWSFNQDGFDAIGEFEADGKSIRVRVRKGTEPLPWGSVLEMWSKSVVFQSFFTKALSAAPYKAALWECVPVSAQTLETPFEFALLDSVPLARLRADCARFRSYFSGPESAGGIVSFPNLGKNATLVVPIRDSAKCDQTHAHLLTFLRGAEPSQTAAFWRVLAGNVMAELKSRPQGHPLWVSTHGLGVPWLHARIDEKPKYFSYAAFRTFHGEAKGASG